MRPGAFELALLWSDPLSHPTTSFGGVLTWLKAISLVCLVCWVRRWLVTGVQGGDDRPGPLVRLSGGGRPDSDAGRPSWSGSWSPCKRIPVYSIASIPGQLAHGDRLLCVLLRDLGRGRASRGRSGGSAACLDTLVFVGIHLALALGHGRRALSPAEGLAGVARHAAAGPHATAYLARRADLRRADRRDLHGLRRLGASRRPALIRGRSPSGAAGSTRSLGSASTSPTGGCGLPGW